MIDVLLVQLGHTTDTIVATSLIKKLTAEGKSVHVVTDRPTSELLSYYKGVHAETLDGLHLDQYKTAINLSPLVTCTEMIDSVVAEEKFGYGKVGDSLSFYNKGAELHYRHRYVGIPTKSNLFQLTYGLAGLKWHGEGYHIAYFPRNRAKKSLTGIAIRDRLLRDYVSANIKLEKTRISDVPFRLSLLKQIDEINRCKHIVTDDHAIMHIALALRKKVELIVRRPPPFAVEMFGSGNLHVFDSSVLKENVYS